MLLEFFLRIPRLLQRFPRPFNRMLGLFNKLIRPTLGCLGFFIGFMSIFLSVCLGISMSFLGEFLGKILLLGGWGFFA